MIIHVVQQGETISSIAGFYGKSVDRLILENGVSNPDDLVVGETLVILHSEIEYIVQEGDTLESIARNNNTSIMQLLRNNPYLSDRPYIYPGEVIVIKYMGDKIKRISTNGFIYPFINMNILKKTLPFLTYLTVYSYIYTSQGDVLNINDTDIIQTAKNYGVAPIMMIGGFASSTKEEINVTHNMLVNESIQDILINNILSLLKSKGYHGVNFKTPYINPEARHLYLEFINKLSTRLRAAGFVTFVSLTMSVFELLSNVVYEGLEYISLAQSVNNILLITYEYGFSFGISPAVVAFETLNSVFDYLTPIISSEKLITGLSTIGYIWRMPYVDQETRGQSMSYDSAIALARETGSEIQFDEVTKASYFQYISQDEYIVRFRDARGVDAILSLIPTHDIGGVAIWNCMFFYNQMWLIVNSQFEIEKVVPIITMSCKNDT